MSKERYLFVSALAAAFFFCACTKVVHVTGVLITPPKVTVKIGETAYLSAKVMPENAENMEVTWRIADSDVATIDEYGIVKGIQEGRTSVTVITEDGGFTATCPVMVIPVEVETVVLNKYSIHLDKGDSEKLTATVYPTSATDQHISWESADEKIATVSDDGTVTALRGGTTEVNAMAGGVKSAICYVNVSSALQSISLDQTEVSLKKGETTQLQAILDPADATGVHLSWTTDDYTVATVESDGTVEAKGAGTTLVKVHAGDLEAACQIKVTVPVTSMTVFDDFVIEAGQSRKLNVHIYPDDATDNDIIWGSLYPEIAYVSDDGVLHGVSWGETTISYRTKEIPATFVTAKVLTHCEEPEAVDLGLSSKWASFNLGATRPEEYGYYYAWGETEPKAQYTDVTYKHVNHSGSSSLMTSLIKYNKDINMGYNGFTDWKATLDNSDDAAWTKLGGKWNIPDIRDIYELYTKCYWVSTTRNGVKGYNITGPSGNSIFLPLAGYMSGSSLNLAGRDGFYWGNQYDASFCCDAVTMWFSEGFVEQEFFEYYFYIRSKGQTIRPVTKSSSAGGGNLKDKIPGTYTVHEFYSRDCIAWEESDTYEMTISLKSSSEVYVSNLLDGGKDITGTLNGTTGDITIPNEQVVLNHSSYGDVFAMGYDEETEDYSADGFKLTYTASQKKYKSSIFIPMIGSGGIFGFFYVEMVKK